MGIQGLIPFLKKSSRLCHLSEFRGQTAAIDSYCWLHKGAFSCAEKLVKGEPTDCYVVYVMKQVNILLSYNIKPILVFDGLRLPSKAITEKKRRENREKYLNQAKRFLREGKVREARECCQRCVDVTSAMAHEVIKICRARNIDIIVAPYEADAQLAYLNLYGFADIIITEDSDLVLFGCDKIVFKVDSDGGGTIVEKEKLHLSMNISRDKFTFEKFRNMCILSGCDYLPSLRGIGLVKACRFFLVTSDPDVFNALRKLPAHLKMPNLEVTLDYREGFLKAVNTVLYQLVFDPITHTLRPLNPYPANKDHLDMPYCGEYVGNERALQIALGNVDVQNGTIIDSYDPLTSLKSVSVSASMNKNYSITCHPSIWQPDYLSVKSYLKLKTSDSEQMKEDHIMVGKEKALQCHLSKRKRLEPTKTEANDVSESYLQSLYSDSCSKRLKSVPDTAARHFQTGKIDHLQWKKLDESELHPVDNEELNDFNDTLQCTERKELRSYIPIEKVLSHSDGIKEESPYSERKKSLINPFAKKTLSDSSRTKVTSASTSIIHSRYFAVSSKINIDNQNEVNSYISHVAECPLDKTYMQKNEHNESVEHLKERENPSPNQKGFVNVQSSNEVDYMKTESLDMKYTNQGYAFTSSILDTTPNSQDKENLSRILKNECEVKPNGNLEFSLSESSTEHDVMLPCSRRNSESLFRFKHVSSDHGRNQDNRKPVSANEAVAAPQQSLVSSVLNKCRVSGLKKGPSSKQKQLSLKELFAFQKNMPTFNYE